MNIHALYNNLKSQKHEMRLPEVSSVEANREQLASLLVFVSAYKPNNHEEYIEHITKKDPILSRVYTQGISGIDNDIAPEYLIINKVSRKLPLGKSCIDGFISEFTQDKIDPAISAAWLASVYTKGLNKVDTLHLTRAMQASGQTYDYRGQGKKIIRRYPSGALSEKTALILPSLLSATSKKYPIHSPFLVAKSLGFTGGTWDKLSTVPGFKFPRQGKETIETLEKCGVSMTVTIDDLCPADRKMYQLRSATGTVESIELATASIASKQLAVPADYLLMDIRTGSGSFFEDKNNAQRLGDNIKNILAQDDIQTDVLITTMDEPDGSSVGNVLEVEEAIHLLGAPSRVNWDARGLKIQKDRVLDFYSTIMMVNSKEDKGYWEKYGRNLIDSKDALDAFEEILIAHSVTRQVASNIKRNGLLSTLEKQGYEVRIQPIYPSTIGQYKDLDQRALGTIINFELGAGQNDYFKVTEEHTGVVIQSRINDFIDSKDSICSMVTVGKSISQEVKSSNLKNKILSCFKIK